MPHFATRLVSLLMALATASPVLAAGGGTEVPEGSALTLFALGILGVIIGRHGGKRSRKRDPQQDDISL